MAWTLGVRDVPDLAPHGRWRPAWATARCCWNAGLAFGRSHPDAIPSLRAAVDAACLALGRDTATLARTVAIRVALPGRAESARFPGEEPLRGTPDQIAESLRAFARAGVDEVQVWLAPNSLAGIETFAPVPERLDRG